MRSRVSVQKGTATKWKTIWRNARGMVEGEMRGRHGGGQMSSSFGADGADGASDWSSDWSGTGRIRSAQHDRDSLQREQTPTLKH